MNSALFDITLGNCTTIMEMDQIERVSYFATQKPILIWILAVYGLLGFILFLFGFSSVGKSRKFLITLPNYFFIFVPYLICGIILVAGLVKPIWIKLFI